MIEKMKVVHIVAAASEKTALLDKLRELGVVHFAEKASADQRHLERFAELSRMEMLLQEYTGQEPEKKLLSDKAAILDAYRKDCITLGQKISLVRGDEVRHGTALDIGSDGDLIVRFEDGTVAPVSSGEVSVRGLYGYV